MRIGIVGAGAAGLMAAATIKEKSPQSKVILFEGNSRIGRKIAISGGGRCNVTTGITDLQILKTKYPRGADFLKFAFKVFPPDKVVGWFEEQGVKLKCEKDMRIFPKSNNAEEVVELFEKLIPETFKLSEKVSRIENGFRVITNKCEYEVDKLILTTGGNAYSHTGSTGDGYSFARELGHTITELGPSLNSFEVEEQWVKDLSGLTLPKAKIGECEGPFLFTHFGISGPVVFAFASHIPYRGMPYTIDLIPTTEEINLNHLIELNGKKSITNVLSLTLPERLSRTILHQLEIDGNKKSGDLSKIERKKIFDILKNGINITLKNRKPGDEFVTAGGVDLSEVNPKTMQSRLNPNLYFAGELLNIDGYTGGFNLQSSWATGRLAGLNVVK